MKLSSVKLLPILLIVAGCASTPPAPAPDAPAKPVTLNLPQPVMPPLPAGAVRVNAIAAIVNDDVITVREVLKESQAAIADAQKRGPVDDNAAKGLRKAVLDRLIDKRLTDQKIKELAIKIGDDEIRQSIEEVKKQNKMTQEQLIQALKGQGYTFEQYEKQIKEQLERVRLVSMEVRSKVYVSAKEVEDYYNANRDKYAEEEIFKARHIFIRINDRSHPDDIKKAMEKALDILHEAKSGKDFAELARERSDDPGAKKDGGDLGSFKRGEMLADLEQALMPLKPGEVGELVSTPSGLHIVKLEEKSTGKVKSFDKVKAEIEDTLYRQKQDERFASWMKNLRAKASVEVKDTGMI